MFHLLDLTPPDLDIQVLLCDISFLISWLYLSIFNPFYQKPGWVGVPSGNIVFVICIFIYYISVSGWFRLKVFSVSQPRNHLRHCQLPALLWRRVRRLWQHKAGRFPQVAGSLFYNFHFHLYKINLANHPFHSLNSVEPAIHCGRIHRWVHDGPCIKV